ncbi:MAG: ABC transporter permease [Alphaproteobacteria bacterium]|nr:ABC transporter permease [Alphaproteobacteria bacterium]
MRPVLPGVVLLVLWEIGALYLFDARFVGQPSKIIASFLGHAGTARMWHHVWVTLYEIVLGYLIGVGFGAAVGYILGIRQEIAEIVEPYILLLNAIPKVAIAPLLIVIFGIGLASKVAIVASLVFFLMFYGVYVGIRTIEADFVYMARIMGVSRLGEIRHVVLPAIMPNVLVAMKTSGVYAVIGAIIGEFIAAQAGVGYFILDASGTFNVTDIWVGVAFLMILLFGLTSAIGLAERRLLRWLPRKRIG